MYQSLNNLTEYKPLFGLFVNTIGVTDVTINHCLSYLDHMQTERNTDEYKKIVLLYSLLEELVQRNEDSKSAKINIRSAPSYSALCSRRGLTDIYRHQFEIQHLVWDPRCEKWFSPSQCVWAEDRITLQDKVSLASTYKEQSSFFRNILNIERPSVAMHIASLIGKASEHPDKLEILQEMRNISALGSDSETFAW